MACKKVSSTDISKKNTVSIDSLYTLLDYPKWQHSDSIYTEYGASYPALKLDRITLNKVKTIFGEPDEETVNSTSNILDNEPSDDYYLGPLIKKLPQIKIYKYVWYMENDFTLTLYFFYDNDSLKSFYGYKALSDSYNIYE